MKFLVIKKIIIASRVGRFIDSAIRFTLSFIPLLHSVVSQRNIPFKPDNFVFFLYGGIGDAILIIPLINKLSLISQVTILCDRTIHNLSFIFPKNTTVIIYNKNNLNSHAASYREQIVGSYPVFIQTSPVIEMYAVRVLLRIPYAFGLISSFRCIRSIGFRSKPLYISSHSRNFSFNEIYNKLSLLLEPKLDSNNNTSEQVYIDKSLYGNRIDEKYVVISSTKSAQWEMGKMPDYEYMNLAKYLVTKHGYKVLFVGHESEKEEINKMIADSSDSHMIENVAGRTSLKELALIMQGAEFVVANDNGVSHMSSFLGVKTLVLFMFSDPSVYEWNNNNYAYIFNKQHECMPCVGLNRFPQDNYPVLCKNQLLCNTTIDSFTVIKKLETLSWV